MKRALTITGNLVLIFTAISCTMGAVISAFWFTVDSSALFLSWAAAALAVTLAASFWRVKGLLALLVPCAALMLWWHAEIVEGAKWLVFFITSEFNQWLYIPVFFSGASANEFEQTVFFAIAGVLLSFPLSFSICLRRSLCLTVLFTAPIVFLTFVLIFSQADKLYLVGLLAVYLTMLFSNSLYPDSFSKRGLAIFPALGLSMLVLGAAYITTPPESYNREGFVRTLDQNLRALANSVGLMRVKTGVGWPVSGSGMWGFDTKNVAISEAGTRVISDQTLLEVTATHAGTFYLRGYSMQRFDGNSWTLRTDDSVLSEDYWARATPAFIASVHEEFFPDSPVVNAGIVIGRAGDVTRDVHYTPYYSFPKFWLDEPGVFDFYHVDDIIELYAELPPGEYHYLGYSGFLNQTLQVPPGRYSYRGIEEYGRYVLSRETYLQIRGSTADGLRWIAEDAGIDAHSDREELTKQVVEFISTFGRYTLTPLLIPQDEDFALYFLETSKQGYCIHYATAATLMLRALGVPARFTSGFAVTVGEDDVGKPVYVTDANAHAWVEVFFEDYGWLPFEVTPPAPGTGAPDGRPITGGGAILDEPDLMEPDWVRPDPTRRPPPGGSDDPAPPEPEGALTWRRILLAVIIAAITVAVLNLRAVIAKMVRKRRFSQEDTNLAVIYAWRYLTRLSRLKGLSSQPKAIEDLALKARFSQHRMTEQERGKVVEYAKSVADDLYSNSNFFVKIWSRYALGL